MANEIKYTPQTVTVNGHSERVSTNGYYTGEHKGTVMQDNAVDGTEKAHATEEGIVRLGTMLGDSVANSMPDIGVAVKQVLTDCTSNTDDGIYKKNEAKTFTYTAGTGKALPNTVTVTIGGTTAVSGTDYTWTKAAGTLAFAANKLSADTKITVTAE